VARGRTSRLNDGTDETTAVRRPIASALLAAFVAVMIAGNLPVLWPRIGLRVLTLDQPWDVFAPDPTRREVALEATLLFADGSEELWHPPRASPAFAALTYHWELWVRAVISGYPPLADAAARWVAARYDGERRLVRVTLRRRWYDVPLPASGAPRLWHESDFYVYTVPS
jgi:hypothetical protein